MNDTTYNGWTNYETWRVNLEMFDSLTLGDFWGYSDADPKEVDAYELGQELKEYAIEMLEEDCNRESLALSYALAFLDAVNWREIAVSLIEASKEEA
jgi:hypothetical protein